MGWLRNTSCWLSVLLLTVLLGGCEPEQEVEAPVPVRAIKTFTVSDPLGGRTRIFSGKIQASTTTGLAFPVAGQVLEVQVQQGDRVAEGQVLARMERTAFQLDVDAAKADLARAEAGLREHQDEYERKQALYEKEWVAAAALDQARAAFDAARSDVDAARSRLHQANERLDDTVLTAPIPGVVAARKIEPFMEVGAGQVVIELESEEALETAIGVPENTVGEVKVGTPAEIVLTALPDLAMTGRVTEVGSVAGAGNVFDVIVSLDQRPEAVRSGMTAEVTLRLSDDGAEDGFLVPLSAIAPADPGGETAGYVFVFDPASSSVTRRLVRPAGVRQNMVAVRGVELGEVIASAGVTFLSDGQPVKLWRRDSR
tara:strand:- start:1369 stop:2478 length:1110 start_codon:yes stop_codon:yes gene_type:complete